MTTTPTPQQPSEDRLDTIDRLRALWVTMLGEKDMASDADFFDLGGDSVTAVLMMSKVRDEFSVELRVIVLLEYPTLEALAAQIDRQLT